MKKQNCWPLVIGLILAWIMSDIFNFHFFLENPEYRWIIGAVAVGVVILSIFYWYLTKVRPNR